MKPLSQLIRADVFALGLLVSLTGCTHTSTRQSTAELIPAERSAAPAYVHLTSPVPLDTISPIYPWEMRRAGTTGLVSIEALVDENGRVQEAKVDKTTHPALTKPTLDAVKKWTFVPGLNEGVPVATRVNIPFDFVFTDR